MSSSLFLTAEELCELTGRATSLAQRKWLKANGYVFAVNANGRPIVAREYALTRLGVAAANLHDAPCNTGARPNFAALSPA